MMKAYGFRNASEVTDWLKKEHGELAATTFNLCMYEFLQQLSAAHNEWLEELNNCDTWSFKLGVNELGIPQLKTFNNEGASYTYEPDITMFGPIWHRTEEDDFIA